MKAKGKITKQPCEMTEEERQTEIMQIKKEYHNILATPLMSEGSISSNQLARMSARKRTQWQKNGQMKMWLEAQIRELSESTEDLKTEEKSRKRKAVKSKVGQQESYITNLTRLGISSKTGKLRPTYKRSIGIAKQHIRDATEPFRGEPWADIVLIKIGNNDNEHNTTT